MKSNQENRIMSKWRARALAMALWIGVPAAIAFVSFRTGDDAEVGIETVPAFRRRGLARVACAALIEDLVRRGLVPVWSCREDNTGSARLAGSLGFAVSRWLPYYEVRATLVR